jgi:hypothetical protein
MARNMGIDFEVDELREQREYSQILVDSASSMDGGDNQVENFIEAMEKGHMIYGMDAKADEISQALRASGVIRPKRLDRKNSTFTAD